ncbi:MAG: hypothetical protein Q8Q36_01415 [bacterium]|nr:hypothetical protein [bacterium]
MTARIIELNREYLGNGAHKAAFLALAWAIGGMFVLYTYLVGSIIFTAVAHREADALARDLRARVGVLEVEHLALSGPVTLELARTFGFKEATGQVFTERKAVTALSLLPHER